MVWWIGIILLVNLAFVMIIRREKRKMSMENLGSILEGEKKPVLRRYVDRMTKENPYIGEITFKMEVIRKTFHLTGLLIVLAYFGFFSLLYPVTLIVNDSVIELINDIKPVYEIIWGDVSLYPYTAGFTSDIVPPAVVGLTMMALMGALMFALISDLIRIIWGPEYSVFNFLTKSMLREKERNAAGPQIYIITGFVFSYMLYMAGILNICAYFTGILIACLSDAAAALIGRRYGRHKVQVRSKDKKSIEGFLAGMLVAYIIGLIIVGPIYAIIGAVIFFITDYFPIYTADNILNPIFIPIGLQIFIALLGLPVGWFQC
jgi:dolichol kinase